MTSCPRRRGRPTKCKERLRDFGCPKTKSCTSVLFLWPYLLCIHLEAVEPLLEELHKGICGSHIGGRSLSYRAFTQRYWWLNIQREVQEYVKKCDQCQRFASNIHQSGGVLNPLSSPCLFARWGLNIVGPFPKAPRNKRWLLVSTDYFTK